MNYESAIQLFQSIKPYWAVVCLGLCWILEALLPFVHPRTNRWTHTCFNLSLGLINVILVTIPSAFILVWVVQFNEVNPNGFIRSIEAILPAPVTILIGVLILDLLMYFWHRINHTIPFLWTYHAVHHSDEQLDATSAFRFHFLENALSTLFKAIFFLLIGVTLPILLIYELLFVASIIFHHSNILLSKPVDRLVRLIFTTPSVHRLHHSANSAEMLTNFGTVFSFWDRLFGSWVPPHDNPDMRFGIAESHHSHSTLTEALFSPINKQLNMNSAPSKGLDESNDSSIEC